MIGLAALALPAGVLGVAVSTLTQAAPFELSERAAAMDARLASERPELVLVGNSLVGEGVDQEALTAALGDPRMSVLWEAGTRPANWYTILRNRVFANGHTPHAIVVVTTPEMLLQTTQLGDRAQESLIDHMGEYEPVINQKVYGTDSEGSLFLQRLQSSRADAQEEARVRVRDASVEALFGEEVNAEAVMGEVFGGEDAVDMSLHKRVIPVLQEKDEGGGGRADTVGPADSFVPDLIALAEEHGSRIVFVWIPVSPGLNEAAEPEPAVAAELLGILNESGAGWLDLHGLALKTSQFKDTAHLNSEGRAIFTEALGEALSAVDLMGDRPLPTAQAPLVLTPTVSRVGPVAAPVALAVERSEKKDCGLRAEAPEYRTVGIDTLRDERLGAVSPVVVFRDGEPLARGSRWQEVESDCGGDTYLHRMAGLSIARHAEGSPSYTIGLDEAIPTRVQGDEGWWAYPGTALRFDFERRPERGEVTLSVHPFGEGAITASVDGQPLTLSPDQRWLSGATPLSGEGPWSVIITSPSGGPFAAVRRLSVSDGEQVVDVVGDEASVAAARGVFAPRWSDDYVRSSAPLTIQAIEGEDRKRGSAVVDIPAAAALVNQRVAQDVLCVFCTPLVITEDDEPLRWQSKDCAPGKPTPDPGRYCLTDTSSWFVSSDNSKVSKNGRAYHLARNPSRKNEFGWWIYPGDTHRYPLPNQAARAMKAGGRAILVSGAAFGEAADGDAGDALTLTLRNGDAVHETLTLSAADFVDGEATLTLDQPLGGKVKAVSLEVTSPSGAPYVLVSEVAISE